MGRSTSWIWQKPEWPDFVFDVPALGADLAEAYRMHGTIEGKAVAIGLTSTSELALEAMTDEVVATAAIEGERLSMEAVRSSVMRRLGLAATGPSDRNVDGLVAVLDDAGVPHVDMRLRLEPMPFERERIAMALRASWSIETTCSRPKGVIELLNGVSKSNL